ncbi:MAG: glycoside hydrolase family 16 protein [Oceanipulchritudo sp.]
MSPRTLRPLIAALLATPLALESSIPAGMELVWSDEFEYSGAPDPAKWTHQVGAGGWGNNEDQTYTDSLENSRVEDGKLVIEVRQVFDSRTPRYTSARLTTQGKASWKYGRMEIRAKVPSETGTWSAIWMLPENGVYGDGGWPDNGEIDIMEHVGYEEDPLFKALAGDPELPNIHGTVHTHKRNGMENTGIGESAYFADASTEFRVYAINWTDGRIEWEVDGVPYFVLERDPLLPSRNPPPPEDIWQWWPFDQPFHLILNIAIGGNWGGHFNSTLYPDDSPYGTTGVDKDGVWPQRMEVDYVRVFAPSSGETWKGLPVDEAGNAQTDSWLGPINVAGAPWIYSYDLQRFLYMSAALEETFRTDDQWIFFPKP